MYSYPLTMPTSPAPISAVFDLDRAQAISESPYTFANQVHEHQGTKFIWTLTYPKMTLADAAAWRAFLMELRGMVGTFYFTPPDGTIRGSGAGSPTVTAFAGDYRSVTTGGWTPSQSGVLLKGDWISFSDYEMKCVLADVNSDGSGNATVYFEPAKRSSVAGGTAIATTSAKGIYRLTTPKISMISDAMKYHEVSIVIQEAI